jgi:hypothetical protein
MDPPPINLVASTSNPNGSLPLRPNKDNTHDSFFKSVQWYVCIASLSMAISY